MELVTGSTGWLRRNTTFWKSKVIVSFEVDNLSRAMEFLVNKSSCAAPTTPPFHRSPQGARIRCNIVKFAPRSYSPSYILKSVLIFIQIAYLCKQISLPNQKSHFQRHRASPLYKAPSLSVSFRYVNSVFSRASLEHVPGLVGRKRRRDIGEATGFEVINLYCYGQRI
ncbi:hypothetical protein TNCV_4072741 [Trichonephila clavipes]|uniref:Uncharacterized protein n=1 Tax=Trichonephila clavipes TaxID=2585209 RepID=A0A8X6W8Z2_TRICX|nr:hypothetical protein TNCV_4072741 [Trichonephila clavipes]